MSDVAVSLYSSSGRLLKPSFHGTPVWRVWNSSNKCPFGFDSYSDVTDKNYGLLWYDAV